MGSFFKAPSVPSESEESKRLREEEEARIKKEKQDAEDRRKREEDIRRRNLYGSRSLQDEEVEGFTGFRRKMGSGSIRN